MTQLHHFWHIPKELYFQLQRHMLIYTYSIHNKQDTETA